MVDRVDGPGYVLDANGRRIFSDGDPTASPPNGTAPMAKWFTGVQESLCRIPELRGMQLDPNDHELVYRAILDMVAEGNSRRRKLYVGCRTGSTSLDVLGQAAPAPAGTLSAVTNLRGPWLQCTTATPGSTPEDIGLIGPFTAVQRRWDLTMSFEFDTEVVTGTRIWVGWFSASPMALTDPASIHAAGFRYEHGVDGALFKTVTSNGTSSTIKSTNLGMLSTTKYRLTIRHVAGGVFEFLEDNLGLINRHDGSAAGGEFVPAAAQNLGPVCALRHIADTNSKDFRFGYWST